MANEITVQAVMVITADNISYQSLPTSFQADMTGRKGPTPGALTIPVGGKVIPLDELVTPGICRLHNIDEDNYVEYGIYDQQTDVFYPLGEILPGESYILRFSRNVTEEYSGTGTGTTGPGNRFFMKANTADVVVSVEAFES